MPSLERLFTALALVVLTLGPGPTLGHPGPTTQERMGAWSVIPPPQIGEATVKLTSLHSAGALPALEGPRRAGDFGLVLEPARPGQFFVASGLYLRYHRLQLEGG